MVDSKVLFVALDNEMEAYYLCGLMNSQIVEDIVKGYTINTNRGVDIVKNINFPKFDSNNPNHVAIANASKRAHEAYKQEDEATISQQEILINQLVPVVFGAIIKNRYLKGMKRFILSTALALAMGNMASAQKITGCFDFVNNPNYHFHFLSLRNSRIMERLG